MKPIPKPLYPCAVCYDYYSWSEEDLYWSEREKTFVCAMCWDEFNRVLDSETPEKSVCLDDEIRAQEGYAIVSVAELKKIEDAIAFELGGEPCGLHEAHELVKAMIQSSNRQATVKQMEVE